MVHFRNLCHLSFQKTIDDSNIEIRSSKGICGINGNEEFTCSRAVSGGTEFQIKDGKIGYQDKFDWCFEAPLDLVQQLKLVLNWQTDLVILSNC